MGYGISWIYIVREIVSSGNEKKCFGTVTFLVTAVVTVCDEHSLFVIKN